MEDHELLREYAEHRSDSAFAELVARHVDLVYSTAFRMVGEAHMARDVAQMVFIGLARKPRSVHNSFALAGWLYRTTRFTAASLLRKEQRRRRWESNAVALKTLESESASLWQAVAPHLEAAMNTLDTADQDAVTLRFFKGQSLRDVGRSLGTSEDAAQKRVTRALEKLRGYFLRQGIGASSTLLASVLGAHAVQIAPPGLAASVASGALASAAGGGTTALAFKLFGLMTATNLKITVAALLVLAAVSTPFVLKQRADRAQPIQTAQAIGPETPPAGEPAAPAANPPTATSRKPTVEDLAAALKLSTREIEAYLQQNRRTAENLLAAFRAGGDKAYLREAAASFPDDPAVQYAVIAENLFPEQRRLWLERFKTNAPDNALASYFSALDYFKTKQADLAIQELTEATGKPAFKTYAAQTSQAVEEMYNLAGRPVLEAKQASACGTSTSHLPAMKNLANDVLQAQQQSRQQGDAGSANSLAHMGLVLAQRLGAGANNQRVIDQLVGISIEKKFLSQLDPAATYDFLGGTVNEVLEQNERQKQAIKEASIFKQQVMPAMTETDLANYLDREKLYGEPEALAWLQTKYGPR
jgi:RNA polymerase sigma factor (sigma-70 family)